MTAGIKFQHMAFCEWCRTCYLARWSQHGLEQDGSPRINKEGKHVDRTALFIKTAAIMKDDWHVVGLKGTRSESYSVEDMFIGESHIR